MKIVVLDGYALNPGDLSWEGIQALGEMTIYDRTDVSDIVERCGDAEIVLTNKVPFSAETLGKLTHLKMIGVMATGYNIIDTQAAKQQGVTVCNIPAYSTASVVQSVTSLLLAITNRVEHYTHQIVEEKRWSRNADFCYWDTALIELDKKRFGVYGLGNIGSRVAMVALSLGMEVVAITSKEPSALPQGVTKVDEKTFWSTCDVISLHCPLTPNTQNLICESTLTQMKQGAIIINTSRGPVVNEQDVANALKSGKLAAFGADVLCTEPAKEDNPLLSAPNVFLTPHIAWATFEARTRLMNILTQNVKAFINGNPINSV
ncbi:MAG: D-2-hydroxyacid dehydrogenase [Bacteroidaceae bacterium]|nr:D-2-hydroxyacid dehydrogenase [Bacteroidaceae bacterium]